MGAVPYLDEQCGRGIRREARAPRECAATEIPTFRVGCVVGTRDEDNVLVNVLADDVPGAAGELDALALADLREDGVILTNLRGK